MFGGNGADYFESVTTVSDGFVVAGYSESLSFDTGDWQGIKGKGGFDATILKYNYAGEVIWATNHGGPGNDYFRAVMAFSDGIIAAGYSQQSSFGSGNWAGVQGNGNEDATIVRFNNSGKVEWSANFGGSGADRYYGVAAVSGGFVAVGYSMQDSFGNGDWNDYEGRGYFDAIAVKHNNDGSVGWRNPFGGSGADHFYSVTAGADCVIAVGDSDQDSFGNGDWTGVAKRGGTDAIIVKYEQNEFVPVTGITGLPSKATTGTDLILKGTVVPSDATKWTITWEIKDAGETGASLSNSSIGETKLSATDAGTAILTATVADGISPGTDFRKDFTITVEVSEEDNAMMWYGILTVFGIIMIAAAVVLFRKGPR
jgi:hypothetical protein